MQTPLFLRYKEFIESCVDPDFREMVLVEPPKEEAFGDFSTNIAMVLSKKLRRSPMELAEDICDKLRKKSDYFEKVEAKKPGFINWFVPRDVFIDHIPDMLNKDFGKFDLGKGRSVNIEYVSANPTGPIHAGHVRCAVSGDVLARLLDFVGYGVTKEFYINDAGKQVEILARSLYFRYLEQFGRAEGPFPDGGYPGEYLVDIAKKIVSECGDRYTGRDESEWLDFFKQFAISGIMVDIKQDLDSLGVRHDVFSSEKKLIEDGAVERVLDSLKNNGLIYEGILPRPKGSDSEEWEEHELLLFRSTAFGDDVDRPLQKSDGSWTYFASDIAYHLDKISRGFDEMVNFWGADHGGYVKRMQAAVSALSDGRLNLDVKLVQLVKLLEDGREVKMSKRAGTFVTAKDILDKVDRDVIRFIMLTRRDDVSLDFDFKKVVDQSRDNPVFYVQYAYARSHSVMKLFQRVFPGKAIPNARDANLKLLDDGDIRLAKIISDWPRQVIAAARKREPHRIAFFLCETAAVFHSFWNQGKDNSLMRFILPDDFDKTCARLVLLRAMQNVVESAFNIIGITPVEELR
ncbi:MAG: arginine--tRNA ligase [Holosporaceae bacterium]|jgi:arginyl-tRNA synthetase|nr:arginine--tRNA ligase [Holosporaceae bacterium]